MQNVKMLINGDLVSAANGTLFECFNPLSQDVAIQASASSAADAVSAVIATVTTASVFVRNIARTWGVAQRIHSGICHINGPTVHDEAQMPFGSVKDSGYGRFGGKAGIKAFTELHWITMQTTPHHYPF